MKKIFLISIAALIFSFSLFTHQVDAASRVRGYTTKHGTYVAPHYRSDRNIYKLDNWSTKGNYNPYTGKTGTKKIKW
jgi:hypothetical protein